MITTVAIPTKNRPALLKRAVRSYVKHFQRYGRGSRITFLVVDGSTEAETRNSNRAELLSLTHETGFTNIRYVSEGEVKPYIRMLAKEGVPEDISSYAMGDPMGLGITAGSARNTIFLDTVGEEILSVDDDTTSEMDSVDGWRSAQFRKPAAPELADDPFAYDPTEFWFFDSRDEALSRARNSKREIDVLDAFETPLGRVPTDLKRLYLGKDHVVRGDLRRGIVRISQAGVLGDTGFSWSAYPLLKGGLTRVNLRSQMKLSREIMRAPIGACVQEGPFCYSHALGLDNSTILPPFLPVHASNGRGGENLYGSILKACCPEVVTAFAPFAMVHDPPLVSKFDRNSLEWGVRIRLHDVLVEALQADAPGFDRAGSRLEMISVHEFGSWIREAMKIRRSKIHDRICIIRDSYRPRDVPKGWHDAIDLVLKASESVSKEETYFVPFDLPGNAEEVVEITRKIVWNFGKLLKSWQDLRTAVVDLRSKRRVRISVPI